jgi:hypothetical protein
MSPHLRLERIVYSTHHPILSTNIERFSRRINR